MSTLYDITRAGCICILALLLQTKGTQAQEYEVEPAPFNSAHSDFGAVRYKDGIVFCSNRNKKKLSFDEDSTNFYTDMFLCRLRANKNWSGEELFAPELTDYLNEGPATFNHNEDVIYYTTNYQRLRPNKKERIDEYVLGIQCAQLINGVWVKNTLFPFNAPKTDYNVAHPALSPNDSVLYFCSNMPGGQGGMDLYKCLWRNGRWSQPLNLGSGINTKGDELFPYVSDENLLYYTSNGHSEKNKKNADLFVAEIMTEGYGQAFPLPYPMNTEYDDFAYTEYDGSEFGLFSSNREDYRDKLLTFKMNTPVFKNCLENQRPVFCYTIEDLRITPIDSLPLLYEWTFGDGNKGRGLSVEHCYDGPGVYDIALNIIDTISNSTFFAVSEAQLDIPDIQQPFILSSDTVLVNQQMKFFADLSSIKNFKVDKHYWVIDHKQTFTGDTLPYVFKEPGYHSVICGVVGKIGTEGLRPKSCTYKEIFVMTDTLPGFPKPDPDPSLPPMMKIKMRNNFDPFVSKKEARLAPVYQILLAQSSTKLTFNSPIFERDEYQITETRTAEGEFVYTIGKTQEIVDLIPLYQSLQKDGFKEARVEVFNEPQLQDVDWNSFRKQEMVAVTEMTEYEKKHVRVLAPEPGFDVPRLPGVASAPEEVRSAAGAHNNEQSATLGNGSMSNPGAGTLPGLKDSSATTDTTAENIDHSDIGEVSTPSGLPSGPNTTSSQGDDIANTSNDNTFKDVAPTKEKVGSTEQKLAVTSHQDKPVQELAQTSASQSASELTSAENSTHTQSVAEVGTSASALAAEPHSNPVPAEVEVGTSTSAQITEPQNDPVSAEKEVKSEPITPNSPVTQAATGIEKTAVTTAQLENTQQPTQEEKSVLQAATTEKDAVTNNLTTDIPARTSASETSNSTGTSVQTEESAKPASAGEMYHVIIIESPQRIPLNDPFFSRIKHEIIEIEGKVDGYTYAVGLSSNQQDLEPLAKELRSNGYDKASIHSFKSAELSTRIVRKGTYIPPKDAEKLNIEFSKLRDIKFEYNSAVIKPESKNNLDYIAAMLSLENDFDLKINAHTCPIGGHAFNMKLSDERAKSVVEYLSSKGIDKSRLHSKGFAETQPIADNTTEAGRKQNRRVEFIIVFITESLKQ